MTGEAVRIDVWLWRARFYKTRALAAKAAAEGLVRVSRGQRSEPAAKPATLLRPGDGVTLWFKGALRTVEVRALGVRRGPASEARTLYAERSGALDLHDGAADDAGD